MGTTTTKQRRGFIQQVMVDFVLGLALFAIVAFTNAKLSGGASDSEPQLFSSMAYAAAPHANWALTQAVNPAPGSGSPGRESTIILGLAFACVFAFDMGLFRHLRRVYASPR